VAIIRPATLGDLDVVAALERVCFTDPWSRKSFDDSLGHAFVRMNVLEDETGIVGYSVVWMALDECELASLAVEPTRRGKGLGAQLLDALLAQARTERAQVMFLEVRANNTPAKHLYASRGFHDVGRRKDYYKNPDEDALVFRLDLG
jgi:ribosomal-protein-alanine N-acetyltransferase